MGTEILQLLPTIIRQALLAANSPSGTNPFATINDVGAAVVGNTIIPVSNGTSYVASSISDDSITVTLNGTNFNVGVGRYTQTYVTHVGGEAAVWDIHNSVGSVKGLWFGNKGNLYFPIDSKQMNFGGGTSNITNGVGAVNAVLNNFTLAGCTIPSSQLAGVIPVANGGTNKSTYVIGDILYASAAGVLTALTAGATGTFPMYQGAGVAPIVSTLVLPNAATINQVLYAPSSNTVGQNANLKFDGTSVGIGGTISSTSPLFVTRGTASDRFFEGVKSGFIDVSSFGAYNDANGAATTLGCNMYFTDGGSTQVYNASHTAWALSLDNRTGAGGDYFAIYRKPSGGGPTTLIQVNPTTAFFNVSSYFGATASPLSTVHVKAGTTSANTAPIQLDNGTRETTARAGVWEYENNFYKTDNSLNRYALGGVIKDFITDVGTPASTAETDLYTYTSLAGTLAVNGDKLDAEYALQLTSTGGITKQIRAYFGGTLIFDTGALSIGAATDFIVNAMIVRDSSTSVRCYVTANTTGATITAYAKVTKVTGLTLSGTNVLKITGTVGTGAAANDVKAIAGMIEKKGAA